MGLNTTEPSSLHMGMRELGLFIVLPAGFVIVMLVAAAVAWRLCRVGRVKSRHVKTAMVITAIPAPAWHDKELDLSPTPKLSASSASTPSSTSPETVPHETEEKGPSPATMARVRAAAEVGMKV